MRIARQINLAKFGVLWGLTKYNLPPSAITIQPGAVFPTRLSRGLPNNLLFGRPRGRGGHTLRPSPREDTNRLLVGVQARGGAPVFTA